MLVGIMWTKERTEYVIHGWRAGNGVLVTYCGLQGSLNPEYQSWWFQTDFNKVPNNFCEGCHRIEVMRQLSE